MASNIHQNKYLTWLFPFLADIRTYSSSILYADIIAAFSVAIVCIPQVMGYALIAGLSPEYGLYSAMLTTIVVALWGCAPLVIFGPSNAVSMVIFATLSYTTVGGVAILMLPASERIAAIAVLCLYVGLIQVVLGALRLGTVVKYVSPSVMTGFVTGAGLLIISGQLKYILGIPELSGHNFFLPFLNTYSHIQDINIYSLFIALGTFALVLLFNHMKLNSVSYLLALVISSAIAFICDISSKGVQFITSISASFPPLSLPSMFDIGLLREFFLPALAIALLGIIENLSIPSNISFGGSKKKANPARDIVVQGLANMVAGITSSMPCAASFSRTVLNASSGAKTRFSGVFVGGIICLLMYFCAPIVSYIPMPALSGILLAIAFKIINFKEIRFYCVATYVDRYVFLITLATGLLLDLEKAIFLGVALSFILFVQKHMRPRIINVNKYDNLPIEIQWIKQYPYIDIYLVEGALFFGAINELGEGNRLKTELKKIVILDISSVSFMDAAGVQALYTFCERMRAANIIYFIVLNDLEALKTLQRTNIEQYIDAKFICPTIFAASQKALDILTEEGLVNKDVSMHLNTLKQNIENQNLLWINKN